MFKKILLAGAALGMVAVPATANAQYYGRTYGTYHHGRHYYWDGHHYRDRSNNAIIDTIIGGILGYAVGTLSSSYYNRYNYSYPYSSYGYSYPYGYQNSYYSYPRYYQYSYPSYGYTNGYYYNPYR